MRIVLAAAAILYLSACGKSKEKEPNDHFTQATLVSSNRAVTGTVASASDIDVYKLEISRAGLLSFHIGGIRSVDFTVSLLDKDRQELKKIDETASGGDERGVDLGVSPGIYYLALSNKDPKADNPGQTYILVLKQESPAGRESEPNDKPLEATPLTPGGLLRGHYFPSQNSLSQEEDKSEQDWFRLQVDQPGVYTLNLDLSEVPKIDPILEIYDSNSYKIKEISAGGPGLPIALRDFGVRGPVQYLLRLRSRTQSGEAEIPYELLTELLPYEGSAEFEPNDQRPDATPLAPDSITGRISPAGDSDWYRLTVASDTRQLLRAELTPPAGMDLTLTVADELGQTLILIDNMGREQPEVLTGLGVSSGTYHLIVSEKTKKSADGRRPYTLTRSIIGFQAGLEYELNDSTASAQAVKVGESVDATLTPKGDIDWFEFNVYQKGTASIELTGLLNVKLTAALFDQDNQELAAAAAKKTGEPISLEKSLETGTYFLRVMAEDPAQNNVRDKYTFRLRVR